MRANRDVLASGDGSAAVATGGRRCFGTAVKLVQLGVPHVFESTAGGGHPKARLAGAKEETHRARARIEPEIEHEVAQVHRVRRGTCEDAGFELVDEAGARARVETTAGDDRNTDQVECVVDPPQPHMRTVTEGQQRSIAARPE